MSASIKASHIADQTCPECGARMVSLAQTRKHTNGQWFEEAKYECDRLVVWSPNFSRLEVASTCRKSTGFKLAWEHATQRAYGVRTTLDTLSLDAGIMDYTIYRALMDKLTSTSEHYWADKLRKFTSHSDTWTPDNSPDVEAGDYIVAADGRLWMVKKTLQGKPPQVVPINKPNQHPVPLTQGWRNMSDISDFQ